MKLLLIIVGVAMFFIGVVCLARRLRGPLIQDDGLPDVLEPAADDTTAAAGDD